MSVRVYCALATAVEGVQFFRDQIGQKGEDVAHLGDGGDHRGLREQVGDLVGWDGDTVPPH